MKVSQHATFGEPERKRLRATLLRESPKIDAVRAGVYRAEAALSLAWRERVPDLVVGGSPRARR